METHGGERCPACGRKFPQNKPKPPLYATDAERKAGVRAKHAANVLRRAQVDAHQILPRLPDEFYVGDVGSVLQHTHGRFWSETTAVIARLERLGKIEKAGLVSWRGSQQRQRWRKVQKGED